MLSVQPRACVCAFSAACQPVQSQQNVLVCSPACCAPRKHSMVPSSLVPVQPASVLAFRNTGLLTCCTTSLRHSSNAARQAAPCPAALAGQLPGAQSIIQPQPASVEPTRSQLWQQQQLRVPRPAYLQLSLSLCLSLSLSLCVSVYLQHSLPFQATALTREWAAGTLEGPAMQHSACCSPWVQAWACHTLRLLSQHRLRRQR